MLIQGAFMHVKGSLTADRFIKFLSDEAPNGHYFVAQPPPGVIMTAAIDWRVIVPDGETADTVATALWSGYEALVKPQGRDGAETSPGIFIQIKNLRGECDQFTVGKDIDEKDGLMHRFKETVAVLTLKSEETVLQEIEKTSASDYWVRIA